MTTLSNRIHLLREALRTDREGRRKQRQLEHELAAYRTPNDRLEIEQIVERYPEAETTSIRRILDRQAA
ncbi:MAG: hypothetical protein ABJD68_11505 [Nakamurella sp.]